MIFLLTLLLLILPVESLIRTYNDTGNGTHIIGSNCVFPMLYDTRWYPSCLVINGHAQCMVEGSWQLCVPADIPNKAMTKKAFSAGVQYGGVPERGVDGNTHGYWSKSSCTYTDNFNSPSDPAPWWLVDLGFIYSITQIALSNRYGAWVSMFDNITMQVGWAFSTDTNIFSPETFRQCARSYGSVGSGVTQTFTCSQPIIGRYVLVQRVWHDPALPFLTVCEVQVFGEWIGEMYGEEPRNQANTDFPATSDMYHILTNITVSHKRATIIGWALQVRCQNSPPCTLNLTIWRPVNDSHYTTVKAVQKSFDDGFNELFLEKEQQVELHSGDRFGLASSSSLESTIPYDNTATCQEVVYSGLYEGQWNNLHFKCREYSLTVILEHCACSSDPCSTNKVCYNHSFYRRCDSYYCTCPTGHIGQLCETAEFNVCDEREGSFIRINSARLVGSDLKNITGESRIACALSCLQDINCKSMNIYQSATGEKCQLFAVPRGQPGYQLVYDDSSSYFEEYDASCSIKQVTLENFNIHRIAGK